MSYSPFYPNAKYDFLKKLTRILLLMIKASFGGMEHINEHWDLRAGESGDMYEDDDDFFSTWEYEVNAYNVVYAKMQPLFVGE